MPLTAPNDIFARNDARGAPAAAEADEARRCLPSLFVSSTEELDADLRGDLFHSLLNLFDRLGQSTGIDIDSDVAAGAGHVLAGLEPSNCLLEIVPAVRTLKTELVRLDPAH